MSVFTAAGEQSDLELNGNDLTVYASDDQTFMLLSAPEALDALSRAAHSVYADLNVKIDKRTGKVDMDSEIEKIKAIAGNAKINIKRR